MKVVPEACVGRASYDERFRLQWQISADQYSSQVFSDTMYSFVQFPERSSTVILRADILEDHAGEQLLSAHNGFLAQQSDWSLVRLVTRKILPRNPRIDSDMFQTCYFYRQHENLNQMLVVFEPCEKRNIPFYHPQVVALAFHYNSKTLTIGYIPLGDTIEPTVNDNASIGRRANRLQRTMLQLAIIITKHSIGNMHNYKKRVEHDLVVPKNEWQDLYTELKGRYASEYVTKWVECTDPQKHVFEDLGIASFLINLRRQIEDSLGGDRPITFVDLGCGNGLLVEILIRERIRTYGFDARRRKSWDLYTAETQAALHEMVLFPRLLGPDEAEHKIEQSLDPETTAQERMVELNFGLFDRNQFLIGNHADELTPYIPLLAALSSCSDNVDIGQDVISTAGFLIIPCCTYTFSGEKHNGLSTKGGRYASYITWLIGICEEVGWIVEREALRIPSTRNCAIICRRRRMVEIPPDADGQDNFNSSEGKSTRDRLITICRAIVDRNGGMDNFLRRSWSLTSTKPRSH